MFRDRVQIRTPRCWHAEISDDNCSFVLLLDDLAPARPGVQVDGCTVDQAVDALRNLAGLHAPVWNDPTLSDHGEWLTAMTGERGAFLGTITESAAEVFSTRYADELGDDAETLRRSAALTGRWAAIDTGIDRARARRLPPRQPHVPRRPRVSVTASPRSTGRRSPIGPPGRDLAYFLATSLFVDDRREHERDLVAEYVDELGRLGVDDYSFDRCFTDYRLGVLQAPMITMIGCAYATAERSAERRRHVPRHGHPRRGRARATSTRSRWSSRRRPDHVWRYARTSRRLR